MRNLIKTYESYYTNQKKSHSSRKRTHPPIISATASTPLQTSIEMDLVNKIIEEPDDLPDLTTEEFKDKGWFNWEKKYEADCDKVYPDISGVAIVTLGDDKDVKDRFTIKKVFTEFGFQCVADTNVDRNSLLALIDMLQHIPPYHFHRQFAFYFSGYGGYDHDNKRAYILTKFPTAEEPEERVYLDWIVWVFKQNLQFLEKRKCRPFCALFFELCLRDSDKDVVGPITLPCCDDFVVAISGLNKASISRNADGGIWTQCLSNNLTQVAQRNLPLTAILDLTTKDEVVQKSKLSPQYVSLARQLFFNESLVKSKYNDIVKPNCEGANKGRNGTLLVITQDRFKADGAKMMELFQQEAINFATIKDTSTPVDCDNVLAIIKAVANIPYSTFYKFFAFYYSGYGGYDPPGDSCDPNGRHCVYLQLGDQKVYLDWIVSLYQQRLYNHLPCMLFFELYLQQDDPPLTIQLPSCDNIVIAISGLNRDTNGGKWTQCLCDNINKYDLPITTILDLTQHQLPPTMSSQYVASTGLMYLKQPLRLYDTAVECFRSTLSSSPGNNGPPGKYYKSEDKPCPGHVVEALNDLGIANKWREIGNILVSNNILEMSKLKNIGGQNNAAAIKLMVSKCENLKWFNIIGAVRIAVSGEMATKIMSFQENNPHICEVCN